MKPFQIKCDASKYASGAVLTQLDSNGDGHPVSFLSKTFNKTEHNYQIYDRELLKHWKNDDITFRDLDTLLSFTWIIRTLPILDQPKSLIDDRPDGPCTSQNLMLSYSSAWIKDNSV